MPTDLTLTVSSPTAASSEADFLDSSDLSASFERNSFTWPIDVIDVEQNLQFLKEIGIDGIKDPSILEGLALLRELEALLGPAQMYADDQTENGLTQSISDNEIGDGRAQSPNDQVRDVPTQLQSRSHKGTNQSDLIDDEMSKEPAVQWSSEGGHFMGTAPIQGSLEPWHRPMNAAKAESSSGKRASLNHVENPTSQQGGKSPQNMQGVAFQTDYVNSSSKVGFGKEQTRETTAENVDSHPHVAPELGAQLSNAKASKRKRPFSLPSPREPKVRKTTARDVGTGLVQQITDSEASTSANSGQLQILQEPGVPKVPTVSSNICFAPRDIYKAGKNKPGNMFHCEVCAKIGVENSFDRKYQLKRHLSRHNGEYECECPYCPKKISRKDNAPDHFKHKHHFKFEGMKCPNCQDDWKTEQKSSCTALSVHLMDVESSCYTSLKGHFGGDPSI
ncbi:hypothetical protein FRC18_010055 [Serendipita sp. 400]|nr:hypothetical protein FRC18_010055 [Serendipita sp. 400]